MFADVLKTVSTDSLDGPITSVKIFNMSPCHPPSEPGIAWSTRNTHARTHTHMHTHTHTHARTHAHTHTQTQIAMKCLHVCFITVFDCMCMYPVVNPYAVFMAFMSIS